MKKEGGIEEEESEGGIEGFNTDIEVDFQTIKHREYWLYSKYKIEKEFEGWDEANLRLHFFLFIIAFSFNIILHMELKYLVNTPYNKTDAN